MTNKEKRRLEWASRIADYRASGQTMAVHDAAAMDAAQSS